MINLRGTLWPDRGIFPRRWFPRLQAGCASRYRVCLIWEVASLPIGRLSGGRAVAMLLFLFQTRAWLLKSRWGLWLCRQVLKSINVVGKTGVSYHWMAGSRYPMPVTSSTQPRQQPLRGFLLKEPPTSQA